MCKSCSTWAIHCVLYIGKPNTSIYRGRAALHWVSQQGLIDSSRPNHQLSEALGRAKRIEKTTVHRENISS
ncbi:hypothetical protein UPYG_G00175300 [Umbra pygmaea]|uniref:Uncharacterized protein n=1 Tax=Umbra pygmaea TaxID=75934 RepID=A0ABD0WPM7_UMBPY